MIDTLATDDCLEVMREARNSDWVSEVHNLSLCACKDCNYTVYHYDYPLYTHCAYHYYV